MTWDSCNFTDCVVLNTHGIHESLGYANNGFIDFDLVNKNGTIVTYDYIWSDNKLIYQLW